MGIHEHERDERHEEDDREDNRDAIQVLLNDARTALRGVHGAHDHVGNARAFAGVQQDEDNQTGARHEEQDEAKYKQWSHFVSLSISVSNTQPTNYSRTY